MKNQSFFLPDLPQENLVEDQAHSSFLRRFLRAWLRISGPKRERFNSSLEDQERLRRSQILSVLFLLVIVAACLIAPTAIPVPSYWIPVCSLLLLSLGSVAFNRSALTTLSGIAFILAIDVTLTILMVTLPHGIRNSNIPDFDLFLLATLIGGIVLPRRLLPFLAVFHILLILSLFTFLPHDPLLTQEIQINQQGFSYGELSDAFVLQVIGAALAWLSARSVDSALQRATRVEDLSKAHRRLDEYMRAQEKQRERQEYGIQVIKEAHARFANGDYRARATLQDNELTSLAFSFNLLAERLNRIAQTAQDYERQEQAFQQLFTIRDAIMHQGTLLPLTPTGTNIDQLYPWLKQFYQLRQMSVRGGEAVEKVRQSLARQRTLMIQLLSALDQAHAEIQVLGKDAKGITPALEDIEKSQQISQQLDEQGKRCVQETRQLEQLLKI